MIHTMLATRSTFSIGESILTVEQIIEQAQKIGAKAVAITDTMTINGMIDFTGKAQKAGIKPILGVRLRLVDDPTWRKTKESPKRPAEYFMTAYIASEAGLRAIFKLLTLANSEGRFYEHPRLGFSDLYSVLETITADDLILATSDTYSVFHHAQALDILRECVARLSASSVLCTLTPINTPLFDTLNAKAIAAAEALGLRTIVTRPVCYEAGGADSAEVLEAICENEKLTDPWHYKNYVRDLAPVTMPDLVHLAAAVVDRVKARGIAGSGAVVRAGLHETDQLVKRITFVWKKMAPSLPVMAPDEDVALVQECKLGWGKRFSGIEVFGHKPAADELREVYLPRLQYELKVLRELKFAGYFLLVQDIVKWSKENGIAVGPGRGSVGGSLVAYLMGITECDPIRFGLLFERFINPGRLDLPDADLDFMSTRRHEVIDYIRTKFGADHFGGVSNYGELAAASSLIGAAKVSGLPEDAARCSRLVPKEHGQPLSLEAAALAVPEIAQFMAKHTEIFEHALRIEGCMRSLGQHAGGIVVSGVPIAERCAIEHRKDGYAVNWDKRTVEDMGLVKMDILGLSTLDTMEIARQYIWERHTKRVNLHEIPLDDPKVLQAFAQARTVGVFQFESGGMRRLLKDVGADGTITFDDITAATALYRPGPMDSGMMEQFVARKKGYEVISYDHPNTEAATKDTYGVAVYQEQVMRIARDFAGFSLPEADNLRKAMGKKDKDKMAAIRDAFVAGAMRTSSVSDAFAAEIFDKVEKFAGYGFNKSHAVEYTLISYQAMWLKVNYPVEFYAAALTISDGDDKIEALVGDAKVAGIEIVPPDINLSTGRFEILTDIKIAVPFNKCKGISDNTTNAILEARKTGGTFASKEEFLARVEKRKCNVKHQDILERVGAFASIEPTTLPANHPERIKDQRELMPGLCSEMVKVPRSIALGPIEHTMLSTAIEKCRDENATDGVFVKPVCGKSARFMVITDAPSWSEEQNGSICTGSIYSDYLAPALDEAGLTRADAYWTSVLKRPKADKQVSPAEVSRYAPTLLQEIAIVKPPLIVCLGGAAARVFIPDLKGNVKEHAGKVVYSKELDANILVGINPNTIYHDGDQRVVLHAIFQMVVNILT